MITVCNHYKEPLSPQSSLAEFSQNAALSLKLRTLYIAQSPLSVMKRKFEKTLVVRL